uniref:BCCT family transporter n=1 Tax=Picosynechococcus sp. (strain ATCC 27264 / PCC 7002 / PR-6) TaxID=32049 RepID=UPI001C3E4102
GPTIFILSNLFQTFGGFFASFPAMSFWTEAEAAGSGAPWDELWNGPWTVFIWCWVIAFSPFVAGFIARISRGRTLREFVLGVTIVPSLIVMVWTAVIASAGIRYDDQNGLVISEAVNEDLSVALFRMLEMVPGIGILLII